MLPYTGEKELECHTARFKLKEARYWLDEMMKPEIFDDDYKFGWHLNAFCNAIISAIDYVHADFVYNKITPSIDWKAFTRNHAAQKAIIERHPESKALTKFRSQFNHEKDVLLKDPLVNYFYNKRQEITHIKWSADNWSMFSVEGENKHYTHRALEGQMWVLPPTKYPDRSLPMFDDYIPIDKQLETIQLLSSDGLDIRQVGNKLCDTVERFIDQFEGKNFFS